MPTEYTVSQGDCISSIAAQNGLSSWKLIWDDPANAALKERRKDPNVLYPGDVLTIPDKQPKQESRGVDAKHTFKMKEQPTKIKVRLLLDDQPRSGLNYELRVDGRTLTGATTGAGLVEEEIPPTATTGILTITEGTSQEIYELAFGTLDPIDTESGLRGRLNSLGFDASGDLAPAVQAFQTKENMTPANGVINDALRNKVKEKFGQ